MHHINVSRVIKLPLGLMFVSHSAADYMMPLIHPCACLIVDLLMRAALCSVLLQFVSMEIPNTRRESFLEMKEKEKHNLFSIVSTTIRFNNNISILFPCLSTSLYILFIYLSIDRSNECKVARNHCIHLFARTFSKH